MLWNLFNFFEDAGTGTEQQSGGWGIYIIFGVMIVLMIVMMIVPQRKAKKQQEEMNKKLGVGVTIMTIGGIIGEIIQMDNEHVWLATGLGEDKIVMQFTQKAIHSIVNAPSTPAEPTGDQTDEVVDEIK
ncbi:MAG: preprotein translocase subunit YajC [Clostridia bacterium]|nr:preprotein translocase subunit YajC [Clostridia bacterium]MBQ3042764.1 preprotein translocase subunit YajC [Clostridia bacterium]MBQ4272686.1 preprotein translocase subunit YajC [Clostridia bacterium]